MPVINPDDYNAAAGAHLHGGGSSSSSNPADAVSFDEVAYKLSVLYPFNPLGDGFGSRDNAENFPLNNHQPPGAAQQQGFQQQQQQQQNGYRQNGFQQNGDMNHQPFHYNAGAMPPNGLAGDPRRAGQRSLPGDGGAAPVDPVEDGYSPRQHGKKPNTTECVRVPSSEHVAEIVGRQGKGGHLFDSPPPFLFSPMDVVCTITSVRFASES